MLFLQVELESESQSLKDKSRMQPGQESDQAYSLFNGYYW